MLGPSVTNNCKKVDVIMQIKKTQINWTSFIIEVQDL